MQTKLIETPADMLETSSNQNSMNSLSMNSALSMASALSISKVKNIYDDCIKLSSTAKVNSKNAFDLQIIEYLPKITEVEEEDNFQVASSAIDASTVIYSKRIDTLYNQTNDLCSRIAVGKFDEEPSANIESNSQSKEANTESDEQPKKRKKPKRSRALKIIDTKIIETRNKHRVTLKKSIFCPQAQIDMVKADSNLTLICKLQPNLSYKAGYFLKSHETDSIDENQNVDIPSMDNFQENLGTLKDLNRLPGEFSFIKRIRDFNYDENFNYEDKIVNNSQSQITMSQNQQASQVPDLDISHEDLPDALSEEVEGLNDGPCPEKNFVAEEAVNTSIAVFHDFLLTNNFDMHQVLQRISTNVKRRPADTMLHTMRDPTTFLAKSKAGQVKRKRATIQPAIVADDFIAKLMDANSIPLNKPNHNMLETIVNAVKETEKYSYRSYAASGRNLFYLEKEELPYLKIMPSQNGDPFNFGAHGGMPRLETNSSSISANNSMMANLTSPEPQMPYDYGNQEDASFCPAPPDDFDDDDNNGCPSPEPDINHEPNVAENLEINENINASQDLENHAENLNDTIATAGNNNLSMFYNFTVPSFKKLTVNIRKVKSSMLKCINNAFSSNIGSNNDDVTANQPSSKKTKVVGENTEGSVNLQQILNGSEKMLSKNDRDNLCFGTSLLSLLHLANDNGFTLQTEANDAAQPDDIWVCKENGSM